VDTTEAESVVKLGKEYFLERLREQRHLLNKSVTEMMKGDLAEALRVAASLRVLIHETGRNKALLAQLNRNYRELEILDSEPPPQKEPLPPGVKAAVVLSFPVGVKITDAGVFLSSEPPPPETQRPTILGKWWNCTSLIIPGAGGFSRKEIVLGLTDKEGGAHVDPEITARYQQLLGYGALRFGTTQKITTLNVSRLMAGQAGLELLRFLDQHFPDATPKPQAPMEATSQPKED